MKKKIHIELCAGAGGLALGLSRHLKFDKEILVEIDKFACETLKINNKFNWDIRFNDLSLEFNNIKKECSRIEMLSGGFPCQTFSYAGKKAGFKDPRGTIFFEFLKYIDEFKPRILLFENVKGLKTHDNGNTFKTIINELESRNYKLQYRVLNSNNYGVAQKRERLIIVGFKFKKDFKLFQFPKENGYKPVLKDVIFNLKNNIINTSYSDSKKKYFELVPPGGHWKHIPVELQKEYMGKSFYSGGGKTGILRRLSWDEPSPTILTSYSQKQTERCHPDEIRPLTTLEAQLIQTFPESFIFTGSVSQKYKQIGNAVPVVLAEKIAQQIKGLVNNEK